VLRKLGISRYAEFSSIAGRALQRLKLPTCFFSNPKERNMKGEGERVLYLLETVDSNSISASYSNGLLTIRMSKQPAQERYQIPITEE